MSEKLGKAIKVAREAKDLDQVMLGKQLGVTKSAVNQWESGKNVPDRKRQSKLAQLLDLDPAMIHALATGEEWPPAPVQISMLDEVPSRPADNQPAPQSQPPTRPDLPVWSAVEGGDDGAIILTDHPIDYIWRPDDMKQVRDGLAFYVVGSSMSPAIDHGDLVVVNPSKPIKGGVDCVFIHEQADGTMLGLVKRLVRHSPDRWVVKQFDPAKQFELSRAKWTKAWRIVEKRYG